MSIRLISKSWAVFFLLASTSACITPSEKKGMHEDIFNAQTRLLNLEHLLADTSKEGKSNVDNATKRIASTQAEMDRINGELQKIHGELDALKVGVTTGQMPGADAAAAETSLAGQVAKLTERIETIEQTQEELLEALKKAGLKNGKKKDSSHKAVASVDGLQQAFDEKKYKQVTDDAPKLVKDTSGAERETARFLLAESYFKLGKIREAALKFNEFLDAKPSKKYLPLAKMRMGDCFKHLGDASTAKVYYEELIKEFPDSDEAVKAKDRLAEGNGASTND